MACGCNINPYNEISSCGTPANKEDVARLFNMLLNNCCLGTINTIGLDPTTNANDAFEEAFPDGISECSCECIFIRHTVTGQIYINCTSNYTNNASWEVISEPNCLGFLETAGLTPDDPTERIEAIDEAFPNGMDGACDIHYIQREDGILCYSTDDGLTWQCPLDITYQAIMRSTGTGDTWNPNILGHQQPQLGQLIRFFKTDQPFVEIENDDNIVNFNDTSVTVNRDGRFLVEFCFQYNTPTNLNGATTNFNLIFRNATTGDIIGESYCKGETSSGNAAVNSVCVKFDTILEQGNNYQVRFAFVQGVTNITINGFVHSRNIRFRYLG